MARDLADLQLISHNIVREVYGFVIKQITEAVDDESQVRVLMVDCALRILEGVAISERAEIIKKELLRGTPKR